MTRRKARNHSPALKAKVALAALRYGRTFADLVDQLAVHLNQIQDWKKCPAGGAGRTFGAQHNDTDVERIYAKIGQLAMENVFLAKFLWRDQSANADRRYMRGMNC